MPNGTDPTMNDGVFYRSFSSLPALHDPLIGDGVGPPGGVVGPSLLSVVFRSTE